MMIKFKLWLLLLTSAVAGVQFVYSVQFAVGAPLFNSVLKLPTSIVGVIMSTAGPISGLVVQPIVGVLSDASTCKWGRRRPFIAIGCFVCSLGLLLVVFSSRLGNALGDAADGMSWRDHKAGIGFAVAGFWVMNIFANVAHAPARALVSDMVDEAHQHEANAAVTSVQALSSILAYVLGAQLFRSPHPYVLLFSAAALLVIVLSIPTLITAREQQYVPPPDKDQPTLCGMFNKIGLGFCRMDSRMRSIVGVFFLSWCGFAPFMVYSTHFFGHVVEVGEKNYDRGVTLGMYGLAIMSACQWAASLVLAPVVKRLGPALTYSSLQAVAAACYSLFAVLPAVIPRQDELKMAGATYAVMALLGVHYCAMNSIPFAMIPRQGDPGLLMGLLNSGSVVAQALFNSVAAGVIAARNQDVAVGIAIGVFPACLAAIASALTLTRARSKYLEGAADDGDRVAEPLLA